MHQRALSGIDDVYAFLSTAGNDKRVFHRQKPRSSASMEYEDQDDEFRSVTPPRAGEMVVATPSILSDIPPRCPEYPEYPEYPSEPISAAQDASMKMPSEFAAIGRPSRGDVLQGHVPGPPYQSPHPMGSSSGPSFLGANGDGQELSVGRPSINAHMPASSSPSSTLITFPHEKHHDLELERRASYSVCRSSSLGEGARSEAPPHMHFELQCDRHTANGASPFHLQLFSDDEAGYSGSDSDGGFTESAESVWAPLRS